MPEITTFDDYFGRSILVQQYASQLEDWRKDSGCSLCLLRNTVFVILSIVMFICTECEKSNVQLRVWIFSHTLLCVVRIAFVLLEHKGANIRVVNAERFSNNRSNLRRVQVESYGNGGLILGFADILRPFRRWKRINTQASEMWWVTGSIWLIYGSESLLQFAPRLLWLTLVFLAIDMFFLAIRFIYSVFLRFAVCLCFPCIVGTTYLIPCKEGASDLNTSIIPQYKFEVSNDEMQPDGVAGRMVPIGTKGRDFSVERLLLTEDTVCCICLCHYKDGIQLNLLPCNPHFHSKCIMKWLRVKANCPLCKSHHDANEQG